MKSLFLAAAILLASSAFAQRKPIRVLVVPEDNEASLTIADGLAGQIGSSLRYALVTKGQDTDILLSVNCLHIVIGGQQVSTACDILTTYWPVEETALSAVLDNEIASGNDSQIIQLVFNAFVKGSSDEKLTPSAKQFKGYLNNTIAFHPTGF